MTECGRNQNQARGRWLRAFPSSLGLLALAAAFAAVFWWAGRRLEYPWQWGRVPRYLFSFTDGRLIPGPLMYGLWETLKISAASLALAFVFGLTTALFRLSGSLFARAMARVYLETIRNTPLLVQILVIYFVLSPVLNVDRFASAVLALSLFEGAYASEIFRAGLVSISRGQWEAASATGMNAYQTYRHVILPQAVARILPPLAGQAVSLIKDSSLVSAIAVYDLTMRGQTIIAETYLAFEIWFTVAAIYLIITTGLSVAAGRMEHRFKASR